MGKKKAAKTAKAILKTSIDAEALRRLRMTAADQGRTVADLVEELIGKLPDWRQK